ncbi:MAG: TonB family protein [Bacteroidetes bacterium]|nr:TonB family protein [Bacteroidota bacterium]
MRKYGLFSIAVFFASIFFGQVKNISVSTPAEVSGGKEALEQVLQTQLTLPKLILTKEFNKEVIMYFELDSLNKPINITFNEALNNLLSLELKRILNFLKFNRKTGLSETPYEYYLTFNLSTEKYKKYQKQKTKTFVKSERVADSSFVIHLRADKSPEYFKGGEEGLNEFIISQILYPDIAKEKSIQGTVILDFVVEENGFVTNISAIQNVGGGCTEEAIRIIKQTKWQPAVLNNKYVRYKLTYPITFNLNNNFKDNSSSRQSSGY